MTPFLQPLIPIAGTEVYDIVTEQGLHESALSMQYNQITTDKFNPDIVRDIYKKYLRKRLLLFVKRTFTSRMDFLYNLKLVAKYRDAALRAVHLAPVGQ